MSEKPIGDLRRRMIADMTVRSFGDKTRHDYIRHIESFARFLGRAPDTASGDDIRRFQLAQVEQGAQPPKMNAQASALRFFFVAESLSGPRLVSATARRYGISTSLLFTWRRACRQSTSQTADNGFVPAVVVPDVRPAVPTGSGRIEIVLANRRRVIVDGGVDVAVLSQLVEALERR